MTQVYKCSILENIKIGQNYFKMTISAPQVAKQSRAGQFVHLRCSNPPVSPFTKGGMRGIILRRPFSIHRVSGNKIEILYRVIGRGSLEISRKKPKEFVDIIGPLGNGFKIAGNLKIAILVAGGMGVAPLVMLAEEMKSVKVLIGAKTKKELLCEKEFKNLGCEVKVSTEDGSKGFKGLVTELLKQLLITHDSPPATALYACGPKEMLKEIAVIAKKHKIPAQVSLEENMACGIGACYGCPVMTKKGYKLICKDGPVFNANDIMWE